MYGNINNVVARYGVPPGQDALIQTPSSSDRRSLVIADHYPLSLARERQYEYSMRRKRLKKEGKNSVVGSGGRIQNVPMRNMCDAAMDARETEQNGQQKRQYFVNDNSVVHISTAGIGATCIFLHAFIQNPHTGNSSRCLFLRTSDEGCIPSAGRCQNRTQKNQEPGDVASTCCKTKERWTGEACRIYRQ